MKTDIQLPEPRVVAADGTRYFSTVQLARLTGRTRQTIRNWCLAGLVEHRTSPTGVIEVPESEARDLVNRSDSRT